MRTAKPLEPSAAALVLGLFLSACTHWPPMPPHDELPDARVIIDGASYFMENSICEIAPAPQHHLTETNHELTVLCREALWTANDVFNPGWHVSSSWVGEITFAATGTTMTIRNGLD